MTFSDHLGPDQTKLRSAWGSQGGAQRGGRRETRNKRSEASRSSGLNPRIVTTTKRDIEFPLPERRQRNVSKKASTTARKEPVRPQRQQPRSNPRLASSQARPKPKARVAPPVAGAWKSKEVVASTPFKIFYDRGDVPICIGHGAKRRVQWKCVISNLDYHHYLPLFFEGLRETQEPYTFLASAGVKDLLDHGGDKVLPVIPQLILPLKSALNTKDRATIGRVLQVIQHLVKCEPYVGEALVPYYRQILPVFNLVLLLETRQNFGDRIDYSQQKRENLIDLVNETLELLEETGGPDAFINIKYMVPTYESSRQ